MLECLEVNFFDGGYPRDMVQGFIVDASSNFYADFEDLVRHRVDEWLDEKHAALPADDEEDE